MDIRFITILVKTITIKKAIYIFLPLSLVFFALTILAVTINKAYCYTFLTNQAKASKDISDKINKHLYSNLLLYVHFFQLKSNSQVFSKLLHYLFLHFVYGCNQPDNSSIRLAKTIIRSWSSLLKLILIPFVSRPNNQLGATPNPFATTSLAISAVIFFPSHVTQA